MGIENNSHNYPVGRRNEGKLKLTLIKQQQTLRLSNEGCCLVIFVVWECACVSCVRTCLCYGLFFCMSCFVVVRVTLLDAVELCSTRGHQGLVVHARTAPGHQGLLFSFSAAPGSDRGERRGMCYTCTGARCCAQP